MLLSGGPLERRSISDEVYARLQNAIVSGELVPGQLLRDYELAERLGTSKTPIRHALDRLADIGLVQMQRNRYTRVAPIEVDRVRNAVDLFGDIWIGSVRHVMPLVEDDDIAYLIDLSDDLAVSAGAANVETFGSALRTIATGFARIEGNSARVTVIDLLSPQIRRFGQHARSAIDWTSVESFASELRRSLNDRDAVAVRACLVTLFDDLLPAAIARASLSPSTE
ncbi:GntR family transcriptional regulator [Microbacterium sp. Se5.02b]|uniref:GntR family transcriptional regulator n=1 Tax=Microbacterium sp. Se5.02b TaxID=2864103 RepID=UPI001604B8ED|nr:GntR family transcriptional regulator [Microbacterium sp. Se5.02b]QNA92592.1 GntR family transcriptional regulator [Microbacterium sp. Se63.02b]QYM65890.1 GntR family transcriptional regulator [Microbacterium sp. Se5.02b]